VHEQNLRTGNTADVGARTARKSKGQSQVHSMALFFFLVVARQVTRRFCKMYQTINSSVTMESMVLSACGFFNLYYGLVLTLVNRNAQ
jgi:hypothetical protein